MDPYLLPESPVRSLDEYLAGETGGLGLARARELGPAATVDEIARSGLRGRGGAGFPTGRKWRSIVGAGAGRRYVVCNAAEGEPATFKDRALIRANPYQLLEGVLIAAGAVEAEAVYLALKASFEPELARVTEAAQEMQVAGLARECEINIVAGPEDYLYGEEKALLEVIEGRDALPRLFPPYEHGLFARDIVTGWEGSDGGRAANPQAANPTLVNNVETLCNVPHVLARGADWFRGRGTAASPGHLVCTVVGDVVAPDVGEVELGTPLGAVVDAVGSGLPPGRTVKAVLPGVAAPVVTDLSTPLSYEGFERSGSAMGAGGYFVLDDTACAIGAALVVSRFLAEESCGQCPPCKLGSTEITERLARIEAGDGATGDLDAIEHWLGHVTDGNRCYLAVQERLVVASLLRTFPDELEQHLTRRSCPRPRPIVLPKLVDLTGGVATYAAPGREGRSDGLR
ncbi:MAG TPA: NADH-ubiquinone oxidoreductase-F iron-sulfur binding region domain-containing protein [Acidimicrobiia bacterium]|nr:NADH-ubiquinone oxidoreductase-F iron-sulfur binding region domain-containing protein [Acidimicrobiia bacterium]